MSAPGLLEGSPLWLTLVDPLAAALQAAGRLPAAVWAMAALAVLASHALRAGRLAAEWGPRIGLHWHCALRLGLLHNAAVVLLPFRSGELGYAWWLHQGWGVPLHQSAPSLLWLRLQDLLVLGGLSFLLLAPGPLVWRLAGLLLLGAVAAAWLRWRAAHRVHRTRPESRPAHKRWPMLHDALAAGLESRGGARAWAFTALNWGLRLGVQGGLLALLLELPPSAGLRGATGGEWGSLLPLQPPAGIGPQEAAVWLALQAHPAARPAAPAVLAAALWVHLFWLGIGLAAAAAAALLPGERPWRRRSAPALLPPGGTHLPQARGLP